MEEFRGSTIAIDFDGVIHSYQSGYTGDVPIDPPVEGILEFIQGLRAAGVKVIIHTCRADTVARKEAVFKWLWEHRFPPDIPITNVKPDTARWFLDDRAVRFEGDVSTLLEQMRREPWHKS